MKVGHLPHPRENAMSSSSQSLRRLTFGRLAINFVAMCILLISAETVAGTPAELCSDNQHSAGPEASVLIEPLG